jgi:hypothetical protein
MSKFVDRLDTIIDEIPLPTGGEDVFILRDKKGGPLEESFSQPDVIYLCDGISRKVFSNTMLERYATVSTQTACNSMHTDNEFRRIGGNFYIWDREIFLRTGYVIANPRVKVSSGDIVYADIETKNDDSYPLKTYNAVRAEIDAKKSVKVVDTLFNLGLMEKPRNYNEHTLPFPQEGIIGVRSGWNTRLGMFDVIPSHPVYHYGLAALEKIVSDKAE